MTLLTEIERCVTLTGCRFEYEDLEIANATIFDKLRSGNFPVCLVLPFDINDDNRQNGVVKSKAELNVLFLDRIEGQTTLDKPLTEIEEKVIAPMRTLARAFVNHLDKSDIVYEEGIESAVHRSTYQALGDAHLYGCWTVLTISFSEDLTTCEDGN